MINERLDYFKNKVKSLPLEPGCYIFKDRSGKIIYIGKAKALKNRVSSYFRAIDKHTEKVYKMVQNAYDFEYIVTDSEFEALVLECSLIKQHTPKYNILLKDDKGYHYIMLSQKPWQKITAVMQKDDENAQYFGPYISSFVVKQTVDEANKVFMLPTCGKKFPQEFGKSRPCLNYYIKQCSGVCRGKININEYQQTIEQAVSFIKGGTADSIKTITKLMEEAAENLEFEKAAKYRDRINAINRISEHQKVIFNKVECQDVIALVQSENKTCAVIIKIRNERLVDKQDFMLNENESIDTIRTQFLLRYYSSCEDIPKQISLDGDIEDIALVEQYITKSAGFKVNLIEPKRGESSKLVEMARNNAAQQLSHYSERTGKELAALDELAKLLNLPSPPQYIEAYDISNIGSDTVVAGMVVFENGRPLKKAYKKFSIKTVVGTDDYASMKEVITRRLNRYESEKDTDSTFARLPDLILLDGGKGHVAVIAPVLQSFGLNIPLYGMVKDDKHKTRAIAKDGGEIAISSTRSAFTLVSKIQEEVHRFSITYSRTKHQKSSFELMLTSVSGIGAKRATALYKHFKTIGAIKAATLEELCKVEGMNVKAANSLIEYFIETEKYK